MDLKSLVLSTRGIREENNPSNKPMKITADFFTKNKFLVLRSQVPSYSDPTNLYDVIIVANKVNWNTTKSDKTLSLRLKDKSGTTFFLSKPTDHSQAQVRCSCPDYRFMWHWWNGNHRNLAGPRIPYTRVPGSIRPPVNPTEAPGLCKHLQRFLLELDRSKIIKLSQDTRRKLNV